MRQSLIKVAAANSDSSDEELLSDMEAARKLAPDTEEYQTQPPVKAAFDAWFAQGDQLKGLIVTVTQRDAAADQARSQRDDARAGTRKSQKLCGTLVASFAKNGTHIAQFGMKEQTRTPVSAILVPVKIDATFDANTGAIDLHAFFEDGENHPCAIEWSQTPNDPKSWVRLDGTGVVQRLLGFAPGTYWFRAAGLRARKISAFFGPVSVIVR